MNISWIELAAIVSVLATIPTYKNWLSYVLNWNNDRKKNNLIRQKAHFIKLHKNNTYFVGWFGESILLVLAILSAALMFEAVAVDQKSQVLSSTFIGFTAMFAYLVAVYKLGQYKMLKSLDKTIQIIDKKISGIPSGR